MRRIVIVLAAALLVLAACGEDKGTTISAVDLLSAAPDKTADQGSARFTVSATIPSPQGTLEIHGDGVGSFTAEPIMELELTIGGIPELAGQKMQEILTGSTIYMGGGAFESVLPPGKKWFSIDLRKGFGDATGLDFDQLVNGQNDPTQQLQFLKGADDVDEVGTEEVNGVETTHYRATLDLEKAAQDSGAITDPERFQETIDQIGTTTLPADVWIDDDGLPRRMSFDLPIKAIGDNAHIQLDFIEFGVDIDIQAPPPAEVADFTEFVGQAQGTGA